MSNTCNETLLNPAWKALYRATMTLSSTGVSHQTVSAAEEAVLARIRELNWRTGIEVEVERDELEDALYTIRALRNSQVYTTAA